MWIYMDGGGYEYMVPWLTRKRCYRLWVEDTCKEDARKMDDDALFNRLLLRIISSMAFFEVR